MKESRAPAWLDGARWYYTKIGEEPAQPVSVFTSDAEEVSSESPGRLCLRLEARYRHSPRLRVIDASGREEGLIRPEGLPPYVKYAMHRNGNLVWSLSVRSVFRRRHALELGNGDSWTFHTPFFWWQDLTGTTCGMPRLVGRVGSEMWLWLVWIEPGNDTSELLSAVAFLHRQWFHS
jgi:hypothetical protein